MTTGFMAPPDITIGGAAGAGAWGPPQSSNAPAGGVGTQSGHTQPGTGEGVSSLADNNSGICEIPCMVQTVSHCTGAALVLILAESPSSGCNSSAQAPSQEREEVVRRCITLLSLPACL